MFTLTSPAFTDGGRIPSLHLGPGHGRNISPALHWEGEPRHTAAYALTLTDDDAPGYQHWLLLLPHDEHDLGEDALLPSGAVEGQGTNVIGYEGPCPPVGTHHYVFTLAALDSRPLLRRGFTADQLTDAIAGHVLDSAVLRATYRPPLRKELKMRLGMMRSR